MAHIATAEAFEEKAVSWMEKVSDEQYGGLARAREIGVTEDELTETITQLAF
jgi:hypothetical protein